MQSSFPGLLKTHRLANRNPVQLLDEMGLQDAVRIRQRGLQKFVSLTHPDHVRHVLVTANNKYVKAPFLRSMWGPYFGQGLLTASGAHWQKHRKIISPAFHTRMIEQYASQTVALSQSLLSDWKLKAETGEVVDLATEFSLFALELVSHTVISGAMTKDEIKKFALDLNQIQSDIRLRDLAGVTQFFPQKPAFKRRKAIAMVNEFAETALRRRRASNKSHKDMLGVLLTAQASAPAGTFPDTDILDEIKTFFLAGFEVTSIVFSWSLYLLSTMPEEREKILKELDEFPLGHSLSFDDLPKIESLKFFIEEVMRLYPPGPLLSRQAIEDDKIDDVLIPEGCLVEINTWQTHRHPGFWDRPNEFIPERFSSHASLGRHKHAYIPFGSGPRVCIGKAMAMMEIQLCLATILRELTFTPQSTELPNFVSTFVMRPEDPLNVTVQVR